jgi:hypothetical protein
MEPVTEKRYHDRIQPNQLLLGWRGWWNRMEAEARKDSKLKKKEKEKEKISTGIKSIKTLFYRSSGPKENSGGKAVEKVIQNTPSSSTTVGKLSIFSQKRKLPINFNIHPMGESPKKHRKVNFKKNLSYWSLDRRFQNYENLNTHDKIGGN